MILYIYVSKQVHVSGCVKTLPRGVGTSRLAGENMLKPAAVPTACARPGEQLMENGCECLFKRCFGRRGVVVKGVGGFPGRLLTLTWDMTQSLRLRRCPLLVSDRLGRRLVINRQGIGQGASWANCWRWTAVLGAAQVVTTEGAGMTHAQHS